jgi:hypothetical protein
MGFLRAWLSVNQGFSAQNLGHYLGQFLTVIARFITRSLTQRLAAFRIDLTFS